MSINFLLLCLWIGWLMLNANLVEILLPPREDGHILHHHLDIRSADTLKVMCVDVEYFKCFPKNTIPFCNNLKPNNVFCRTIQVCIVQMVILFLTLYICKVISHLHENTTRLAIVRPSITINITEEETPNDNVKGCSQIRQTSSSPNTFIRFPTNRIVI